MTRALRSVLAAARRQVPRRLSRTDCLGLGVLVVAPLLLFVPFSLAGHPLVPGDDLTQNYPLRVLAGALLRSGHLPAWDPFIWSGTPLLAGWNAGAAYPGTWLFAVLPGIAAWTVNLVSVGVIAGTGVYALLRLLGCAPLGAVLGALVFTDSGFISGQLVHIGLVQGTGFMAWMLVAIELLARPAGARGSTRNVLLLGLSVGLCILAAEPRAISTAGVVLGLYLAARALRLGRRQGLRLVASAFGGIGIGAGLGAIQWVPGLTFLSRSQRGLGAYQFFGAGSLSWTTIAHLLLVPFLLGGNGNFGLPLYRGGYNLAELTIGVGLLPLVAVGAYLPELCTQTFGTLRRVRSRLAGTPAGGPLVGPAPPQRRLGVWYVMGGLGLVLTLGTTTPLGHLLVYLPLYGGERLQNRNAAILDLVLAVLVGFFVDDVATTSARRRTEVEEGRADPLSSPTQRLLALAPPFAALALVVLAYLHPKGLEQRFGVARPTADLFIRLAPYLGVTVALAVAVGLFVLLGHRLQARPRAVLVALLVCFDVGVYVANASFATAPASRLAGPTRLSAQLAALSGGGRFAIYNPLVLAAPRHPGAFSDVGEPDLNIVRGATSVQGYGSIVGGAYEDATSTHDFEDLDPAVLGNRLADVLDLRVLLTLPAYLEEGIPPHSAVPVAGGPPVTASGLPGPTADAPAPPLLASGPWTMPASVEQQWLLPSVSSVLRVAVVLDARAGRRPTSLEVGFARPGRAPVLSTVPVVNGQAHLDLGSPHRAESVVVRNPSDQTVTIGAVVVVTHSPAARLLLDGSLQGALVPPQWSYAGRLGPFAAFVNRDAAGRAWLQPTTSRTPDVHHRAAGRLRTVADASGGTQQMLVTVTRPTLLVRSVAYQPGWTAELARPGGMPGRSAPVERLGLLQAVRLPAGRYLVTWHYAPRGLLVGLGVTIAALVVAGGLVAVNRRRWKTTADGPKDGLLWTRGIVGRRGR